MMNLSIIYVPEISNVGSPEMGFQLDKPTAYDRQVDNAIERAYKRKMEAKDRIAYRYWSLTCLIWIEKSYTSIKKEKPKGKMMVIRQTMTRNRLIELRNTLNYSPNQKTT